MRKVCLFTSTRADFGLLSGLANAIAKDPELKLQLLVSGTHLSTMHGETVREIEAAGFAPDARVPILDEKGKDDEVSICQVMGRSLAGYGEALKKLSPDIVVILGDRYEAFCCAAAAQVCCVPIAHIHGGETTEGAVDEAFRHSITKMSHLHFPSCEEYRRRIIQLGEAPARVYNVGALGIENIRKLNLLKRAELASSIHFPLDTPFFLVTFHPVTLEKSTACQQFSELLVALERFPEHKIIFTKSNADTDGQVINRMICEYVSKRPQHCLVVASLGLRRYLSAMRLSDAVIGNSSSGILETPIFGVPTVNIGDRQKGRLRTESIIDCPPDGGSIVLGIQKALNPQFRAGLENLKHPCEKTGTVRAIVNVLETAQLDDIIKKSFYDMELR